MSGHTTNDEKNEFHPRHTKKNEKSYFTTKFVFKKKKYEFQFQKVFLITLIEGNGRAEVGENNSNGTFICDDDAHKVVLSPRSPFFYRRWV